MRSPSGALQAARAATPALSSPSCLRGFARGVDGPGEHRRGERSRRRLKTGAETAYKAVMKPKEGTILTVARVIAETAFQDAEASIPTTMHRPARQRSSRSGEAILEEDAGHAALRSSRRAWSTPADSGLLTDAHTGMARGAATAKRSRIPSANVRGRARPSHSRTTTTRSPRSKYNYCTEFLIHRIQPRRDRGRRQRCSARTPRPASATAWSSSAIWR